MMFRAGCLRDAVRLCNTSHKKYVRVSYQIRSFSVSSVRRNEDVQQVVAGAPTVSYIPEPPAVPIEAPVDAVADTSLQALGLAGWTPVGCLQSFMEQIHLTLDIPWWGSIAITTVILRTILLPVAVSGQKRVAKMQNNFPEMQRLQAAVQEAQHRGDKLGAAMAAQELMEFMKVKDIHPFKHFIPLLVQFPVFISMFLSLRGMCNAPVPSFADGGLFWFMDLTVPDPFYMVPIFTSATMFFIIKNAAEGGATPESMSPTMRYVLMGMPIFILPFTVSFPAGVTCYWAMTNLYSVGQHFILKNPKLREKLKIPKLIKHDPKTLPKRKGFKHEFREAMRKRKVYSEEEIKRASERNFIAAATSPVPKTYPKPKG